ncbi:MAG: formylglycine-generating enzyme family protein [Chitinispirillales bacterium]|jgi:formylglycine-generating enzyme required for sulfatase activity|nr:formylglycine-generating enzyme family protein [Chitinispirillales bacterium]
MTSLRFFWVKRKGWIFIIAVFAVAVLVQVCNTVPEYCGEGNKLNPETQFCFNNKTYDKCGGAEYDPTNQSCERGVLKAKCAGGETFYNPETEFCRNGNTYEKCGGNVYNPDSQTCTNGAIRTKCGNEYFSQVSEFCFNEIVYPKCGGNTYIPTAQVCENGVLLAKCGDNNYNPTLQFCTGGQIYPKCGGAGGVEYDPSYQSCEGDILKSKCGNDFFNPASQFCLNERIYSKCGGREYDPATQACDLNIVKTRCGSNDIYDSTTAFCLNNTVYQKCRGVVWEPASQKCENGVVKEKCGSDYYDTTIQFCYMNNTIYDKCNGRTYDPMTEECKEISMVFVQGGTFTMGCTEEQGNDCRGSERPAHRVTLSSFYIGRYEISQAQWEEVMGYNPSVTKGYDLPVTNVRWDTIQVFIRKLNTQTGKNYRLPTEAEWEYAARGGMMSRGYKYAGSDTLGNVAWHYGNSGNNLHIIGTKQANELGIYDMSGNVAEWCHDDHRTYNNGSQSNPTGSTTTNERVYRGGSYYMRDGSGYSPFGGSGSTFMCRVSNRDYGSSTGSYTTLNISSQMIDLGFRLAHSP